VPRPTKIAPHVDAPMIATTRLIRLLAVTLPTLGPGGAVPSAAAEPSGGTVEACRAIADSAARLRCFERASSGGPERPVLPAMPGGWRLVRTPRAGEAEAVSIMHTADPTRSDIDLAGLMLRCAPPTSGAGSTPEILFVVVQPFAPHSAPDVSVTADGRAVRFVAAVVPPFTALRLPPEAGALAAGTWQRAAELAVEIALGPVAIRGVVPVSGLEQAYQSLVAGCPPP
jgi:hypothetical protein